MNDTIETLGVFAISGRQQRFSESRERCRRLANADALKRHERVNAFNLVDVLVLVVISTKAFSVHNRYVIKLRTQIGDNIIHNRTVSDFQVKSYNN